MNAQPARINDEAEHADAPKGGSVFDPFFLKAVDAFFDLDERGRRLNITATGKPYDALLDASAALRAFGASNKMAREFVEAIEAQAVQHGVDFTQKEKPTPLTISLYIADEEPTLDPDKTHHMIAWDRRGKHGSEFSTVNVHLTNRGTATTKTNVPKFEDLFTGRGEKYLIAHFEKLEVGALEGLDTAGVQMATLVEAIGPVAAAGQGAQALRQAIEEGAASPAVEKLVETIADINRIVEQSREPGIVAEPEAKIAALKNTIVELTDTISRTENIPAVLVKAVVSSFDKTPVAIPAPTPNEARPSVDAPSATKNNAAVKPSAMPSADNDNRASAPVPDAHNDNQAKAPAAVQDAGVQNVSDVKSAALPVAVALENVSSSSPAVAAPAADGTAVPASQGMAEVKTPSAPAAAKDMASPSVATATVEAKDKSAQTVPSQNVPAQASAASPVLSTVASSPAAPATLAVSPGQAAPNQTAPKESVSKDAPSTAAVVPSLSKTNAVSPADGAAPAQNAKDAPSAQKAGSLDSASGITASATVAKIDAVSTSATVPGQVVPKEAASVSVAPVSSVKPGLSPVDAIAPQGVKDIPVVPKADTTIVVKPDARPPVESVAPVQQVSGKIDLNTATPKIDVGRVPPAEVQVSVKPLPDDQKAAPSTPSYASPPSVPPASPLKTTVEPSIQPSRPAPVVGPVHAGGGTAFGTGYASPSSPVSPGGNKPEKNLIVTPMSVTPTPAPQIPTGNGAPSQPSNLPPQKPVIDAAIQSSLPSPVTTPPAPGIDVHTSPVFKEPEPPQLRTPDNISPLIQPSSHKSPDFAKAADAGQPAPSSPPPRHETPVPSAQVDAPPKFQPASVNQDTVKVTSAPPPPRTETPSVTVSTSPAIPPEAVPLTEKPAESKVVPFKPAEDKTPDVVTKERNPDDIGWTDIDKKSLRISDEFNTCCKFNCKKGTGCAALANFNAEVDKYNKPAVPTYSR